jgi:hypothetical protein
VNGVLQTNPFTGSSALTENRAKFLPSPRIGFAWDLFGNGKTAIRGGGGIYYGLLDTLDYRLGQTAPFNTTQAITNVPVSSLNFVPGTPPPAGSRISPSNVQPDIATPTVLSWSLRIEQQIAPHTAVTVGYVGSHGYHQILSEDMNEPVPGFTANGQAYYPYAANASGPAFANPALANTTSWVSQGVALYNALVVDVKRNFAGGLQFRGNYTYSKNLDDGSAWNTSVSANTPAFVSFPAQPKTDWGPAATDIRNIGTFNASYELPFGRHRHFLRQASKPVNAVVGEWQVSAIGTFLGGFPFSPQLGYNPTANGDTRNPVRPSWNPNFDGNLYPRKVGQYFNPNAFITPTVSFATPTCGSSNICGTYGNVKRDSLVGPGSSELDFSATKSGRITEGLGFQFRAEFFNILNHTNFLTPNPVVFTSATSGISPTAGVITATSTTARQIQFGAKLQF